MLLFIGKAGQAHIEFGTFQYISCYSLSIKGFVVNNAKKRFNTSHVTLYHKAEKLFYNRTKFQYISCYSLSAFLLLFCHNISTFQYISCYSLSFSLRLTATSSTVSIHLMLLFISIWNSQVLRPDHVSIHLMLLFIWKKHWRKPASLCFNTSHVTLYRHLSGKVKNMKSSFNTSHVTLYRIKSGVSIPVTLFQYISCYSLSVCSYHFTTLMQCFNTSHVTLYLFMAGAFVGGH